MCVNSYTHDIDTVSEYEQYDIDFDNGPKLQGTCVLQTKPIR